MELVRLNNTRPTILHLPDMLSITDSAGGDMPRVNGIGTGRSLVPGGNNIDATTWTAVKKNRTVLQWLKLRWITEGGDTTEPEGPPDPETLLEYNVTTAVALAEGEPKLPVLERWLKADERPDVTMAIKRKIEALGGTSMKMQRK